MQPLSGKKVLLGITGSIAAYKSISLVRDITAAGGEVQVVLTPAAQQFVPPLPLQIFSKKPVYSDLFSPHTDVVHVTLATGFDLIVIAPVTADFMAKMALGLADDLLSTLLLSTRTPVLLAPAMDLGMWDHPAVLRNVALLKERGCVILDPESGPLASGQVGVGRMADPKAIFDQIGFLLTGDSVSEGTPSLAEEVVLVTAGPTREAIDPVRFISNRSSGKMGYAVAEVASQWGARVILVTGPTALPPPPGVQTVSVQSAEEMKQAVDKWAVEATIVVMAAAVGDYTPIDRVDQKIKRMPISLRLKPTEDIIAGLARNKGEKFLVGFAAETRQVLSRARAKLISKGLDLIVANDVTLPGAGFDVDTNVVDLIYADGRCISLPKMPKRVVAERILEAVLSQKKEQVQRAPSLKVGYAHKRRQRP
jgi:phosphopantothenoylcysteine decarboxylase/phosphopantothenate--cysteine ligase